MMMPMNIEDLDAVKTLIEPIASEIANLSRRIVQNRSAVSASETATRNQLIEPLMRVLGWDAADPDLVVPEYSVGHGRVDYALMQFGKPIVLIEAKKLGTKLTAETLLQAFGYVDDPTVKYVVVCNGDNWEAHRTPLTRRVRIASFVVSSGSTHSAALEAAKLSRQVLITTLSNSSTGTTRDIGPIVAGGSQNPDPRSDQANDEETVRKGGQDESAGPSWVSLEKLEYRVGLRRPDLMQLPDGRQVVISSWKKLWIEVAEWVTAKIIDVEWRIELRAFGPNMAIRTENT